MTTHRISPDEWTDRRHRDGLQAELDAAEHLTHLGWTIEAHRFRLGRNDLDLIARRADLVAFVEVKARWSTGFGTGEEAVVPRKRRVIERVAWWWIMKHGKPGDQYRFDIMVIGGSATSGLTIRHLEDAWRPGWR